MRPLRASRRLFMVAAIGLVVAGGVYARAAMPRTAAAGRRGSHQTGLLHLSRPVADGDCTARRRRAHGRRPPRYQVRLWRRPGKAFFEEHWKPEAPDSRVWHELAAVLALGGTFSTTDTFVAPYALSRWPRECGQLRARRRGRRSREHPCRATCRRGVSRRHQLRNPARSRASPSKPPREDRIELSGKKVGYVASRFVRSPIGYRAYFSRSRMGSGRC